MQIAALIAHLQAKLEWAEAVHPGQNDIAALKYAIASIKDYLHAAQSPGGEGE